jgi:hypothetical protein
VLVLDMIEILPPLGKYKYDTWRILLVKCYIDNSIRLQSCIRNVNKHFWHRCQGGSQYRLIPCPVVIGKCLVGPESPTVHHSFLRFMSRFILIGLLRSLIRQVSKKSNQRDPGMSFNQLANETFAEAWERYHGLMTNLPDRRLERLETHPGILLWVVTRS